jgi:hypothetical protein
MSTYGVRVRFIDMLVSGHGVIHEEAFRSLVDYARERGVTAGEARALLQPAEYLATSRVLRGHGIRLEDIRFEPGAWKHAQALARELGIEAPLARLPNAQPGSTPPPSPTEPARPPRDLTEALGRGTKLDSPANWRVQTSGATISFAVRAGETVHPAVIFDAPKWTDPAPRDLVAEEGAALREVRELPALVQLIRSLTTKHRAYFDAADVKTRSRNELYGIQDLRRHAFFSALGKALADSPLGRGGSGRVQAVLLAEKERLLCDRDYAMDVGSHTNYWPYWDNYLPVLEKMLAQTAPRTAAWYAIKNRIEDVLNHKTVFGVERSINERSVESSINAALVHRLPWSDGNGHRVSVVPGSGSAAPVYEVLSIHSPLNHGNAQHAGAPVFRDSDGTLRFDRPGGEKVPAELERHIEVRRVPASELGIRALAQGEQPRRGIPSDWNRDGALSVTPIEISWWGHCHNEAPLNAMGVDPKRGVELYRADRKVPREQARQSYSAEDIWDACGALTADHEHGWVTTGRFGSRPTEVETTKFVGSRNNGGHWILLELGRNRRVRVDAEVTELWHKSDPSKKYPEPMARFRRDIPNADGSFSPNPDWVDAGADDEDEINLDALGRRLSLTVTYVTFDERGDRREVKETLRLDPAKDAWVKLADETMQLNERGGGRLIEHWYNPKTARYQSVTVEVAERERFRRVELSRQPPIPVTAVQVRQETVYDSVIDIHDFITKNMGLPFTCDTSSGLAVWNYPVDLVRIDRVREVEKVEDGRRFSYTTYRLQLRTMGGPSVDASYIIKRDEQGNAVRAVAIDPMPDFAYRNEHWVCAPAAPDLNGTLAYNTHALQAGFLTDKARERLVPEVWRRLSALVYVSLSRPGEGPVYLFEQEDGTLILFDDAASFEAAVQADQGPRDTGARVS